MPDEAKPRTFVLPLSIVQPVDIGHIIHELGLIDEHFNQEALKGSTKPSSVKPSTQLAELIEANGLDFNNKHHRADLIDRLEYVRKSSPTAHISFSGEASGQFIQSITKWFRKEIDPYCLVIVGLEPSIGLGAIVRTNNKVFDLSLRARLEATRDLLMKEVKQLKTEGS